MRPRDELVEEIHTTLGWIADDLARGPREGQDQTEHAAQAKRQLTVLLFKLTFSLLIDRLEDGELKWGRRAPLHKGLIEALDTQHPVDQERVQRLRELDMFHDLDVVPVKEVTQSPREVCAPEFTEPQDK